MELCHYLIVSNERIAAMKHFKISSAKKVLFLMGVGTALLSLTPAGASDSRERYDLWMKEYNDCMEKCDKPYNDELEKRYEAEKKKSTGYVRRNEIDMSNFDTSAQKKCHEKCKEHKDKTNPMK